MPLNLSTNPKPSTTIPEFLATLLYVQGTRQHKLKGQQRMTQFQTELRNQDERPAG